MKAKSHGSESIWLEHMSHNGVTKPAIYPYRYLM